MPNDGSTNELMIEILRGLQTGQNEIKDAIADLKESQLRTRKEVNDLRGDVLRQESWQAVIETRLDRIDTAVGITSDTPDA